MKNRREGWKPSIPAVLTDAPSEHAMSHELGLEKTNVNIVPVDNMGDAREASQEEAANTGGLSLPGILFKQGQRYCVSTAIPVRRVRTRLEGSMRRSVATSAATELAWSAVAERSLNICVRMFTGVLPPMTTSSRKSQFMPRF